jgi:hypothetical protein
VCAAVIISDIVKRRVKCGSVSYWAISLSLVPFIIAASAVIAWWLVRKNATKVAAHHELQEGEVSGAMMHLLQDASPGLCCLHAGRKVHGGDDSV